MGSGGDVPKVPVWRCGALYQVTELAALAALPVGLVGSLVSLGAVVVFLAIGAFNVVRKHL